MKNFFKKACPQCIKPARSRYSVSGGHSFYRRGISIVGILILVAIGILILSFFDVRIRSVVESPAGEENIGYVRGAVQNVWTNYLKRPAVYLWNDVFINIFWRAFIENMERVRDGKPTDFDTNVPTVSY